MSPLDIFLSLAGLGFLCYASLVDIKTREIPDWIPVSMLLIGLSVRGIIFFPNFEALPLMLGIWGFIILGGIGYLMFLSGVWGGGDAKLMAGIGAMFGLKLSIIPYVIILAIILKIYWWWIFNRKDGIGSIRKLLFEKSGMPFVPAIALGTFAFFLSQLIPMIANWILGGY